MKDSVRILRDLGCEQNIWEEFLIWAVYRSGWNINRPYTARCKNSHAEHQYRCLYAIIKRAVRENPHRNVLLDLMAAIGLASPDDCYDEWSAGKLLISKALEASSDPFLDLDQSQAAPRPAAWDCGDPEDFGKYMGLWAVDSYIIHDSRCDTSNGSKLIAMANALYSKYASGYRDRAMLIASNPESSNKTAAMMAFIQLSMMGMACYVLMDDSYSVCDRHKMALFAPPNAVCSRHFFADIWSDARTAAMVWAMTYGV